MKLLKGLFGSIIIVVLYLVGIVAFFVWNYFDTNLTIEVLPYAILYYVAIVVLFFSIANIASNLSYNNKRVLLKKYQIYKEFHNLDKDKKLNSFEKFCIDKNNKLLSAETFSVLNQNDIKELEKIVETKDYKEIEKYLENLPRKKRKKVLLYIENYNRPYHFEHFYNYHNNSMLKKKESIFGFIWSFVSFVVALLPFFLEGFAKLSVEAYLDFATPIFVVIFEFVTIYKINVKSVLSDYSDELKELQTNIADYTKIKKDDC